METQDPQMQEHPWLMLTLRRTGGTSLTGFLQSISSFPPIQHEPFNPDRKLGWIARDFNATGDAVRMAEQMTSALASRPNLKHCLEIVRPELTRALIETCEALGYRFLVLTRRDEAARLRSLALAVATGAWGPEQARKIYPRIRDGRQAPQPVDLKWLEQLVRNDYALLGRCLRLLRNRRIPHRWLVFEEVYDSAGSRRAAGADLAADMGIVLADDDPRLARFADRPSQNSHSIADHVPDHAAVVALLERLCLD